MVEEEEEEEEEEQYYFSLPPLCRRRLIRELGEEKKKKKEKPDASNHSEKGRGKKGKNRFFSRGASCEFSREPPMVFRVSTSRAAVGCIGLRRPSSSHPQHRGMACCVVMGEAK